MIKHKPKQVKNYETGRSRFKELEGQLFYAQKLYDKRPMFYQFKNMSTNVNKSGQAFKLYPSRQMYLT